MSDWIPLTCVLTFVAAFSLGPNPISWLLVGEMFPLEYRGLGSSLTTAFSYICAFVGVKTFVDLRENLGLHGTFWTYAIIAALGFLFSLAFVPETKGVNLDEMRPKSSILNSSTTESLETEHSNSSSSGTTSTRNSILVWTKSRQFFLKLEKIWRFIVCQTENKLKYYLCHNSNGEWFWWKIKLIFGE